VLFDNVSFTKFNSKDLQPWAIELPVKERNSGREQAVNSGTFTLGDASSFCGLSIM